MKMKQGNNNKKKRRTASGFILLDALPNASSCVLAVWCALGSKAVAAASVASRTDCELGHECAVELMIQHLQGKQLGFSFLTLRS